MSFKADNHRLVLSFLSSLNVLEFFILFKRGNGSNLVSAAVIMLTENNLPEKRVDLPHIPTTQCIMGSRGKSSRQTLKQRPRTACWLVPHGLFSVLSYTTQGHLFRMISFAEAYAHTINHQSRKYPRGVS